MPPYWRPARLGLALVTLLLSANATIAISLSEYHERVKKTISALDLLNETEEGSPSYVDVALRTARESLPQTDTIDWSGTSITVDNSWLDRDLREFEHTPSSDPKRTEVLKRVLERLAALEERLQEAAKPVEASTGTKAVLKDRLARILLRPEYAHTAQAESALARLVRRIARWIASLFPERRPLTPGRERTVSRVAQVFVVVLALAALAYVVKLFLPRLLRNSRGKKKVKAEARIVLGERLEPDQSSADLLAEAEKLARAGDLRGAIRKGYIALLVELGDRNIISLAQHKTNWDYLRSVRELKTLYPRMQILTSSFESHWYGSRQATEVDWVAFRNGYREVLTAS